MCDISKNLECITQNIKQCALNSNRNFQDIVLLCVSKTQSLDKINKAYELGCRDFGENKVQELLWKQEALPKDIKWHMIGHLQSNKVKYIAPFITCIHSVDSYKLANVINNEALKHNRIIDILVEVNVANEESKFGININEVEYFIKELSKMNNISVKGLMTIAPNPNVEEDNREYFEKLYKKYIDIKGEKVDNVSISMLSMGMSKDYKVAIEEGSTIVRIGSDIFGTRN